MSTQGDHWTAEEQASALVVLICVGMMAFGMLFYIVAKPVTHAAFERCLREGCDTDAQLQRYNSEQIEQRLKDIAADLAAINARIALDSEP